MRNWARDKEEEDWFVLHSSKTGHGNWVLTQCAENRDVEMAVVLKRQANPAKPETGF